ncbi:hypothetical protein ACIRJM_00570 [Streptomyces sp. NPDC102405]|uniref:hypothetical protein n=1 Tax=Streptomyces sp. NPDC102405 TaxID=3366170 RepID=UPI0038219137
MTDQDLTVRRARPDDIPGLVASSAGLFAEDAEPGTRASTSTGRVSTGPRPAPRRWRTRRDSSWWWFTTVRSSDI